MLSLSGFGHNRWSGHEPCPARAIGDGFHSATAAANLYLHTHPATANDFLITSSAIIDLLTLFLLSLDFSRDVAAVSGLGDCPGIAADHAGLIALRAPPGGIWHYPGFPSLLVTYGVANDYFFSAHTALTVLAATELARLSKRWLAILAVAAVLFEMTTVLVLRAHYTMDAFTGVVTGLYAAHLAGLIADWKQRKARFP